jgi:hypothetical protein
MAVHDLDQSPSLLHEQRNFYLHRRFEKQHIVIGSHVLAHLEWVLEYKRNPRFVTFQFVLINVVKNDKPNEKRISTQECFYCSSLAELTLLSRIGIPEPLSDMAFNLVEERALLERDSADSLFSFAWLTTMVLTGSVRN